MKRAVLIAIGLLLVGSVAYVVSLNRTVTEFYYSPQGVLAVPLGGLVISAFLTGALVVLVGGTLQATGRALSVWRIRRKDRRRIQVDSLTERARNLLWSGDLKQARALLEKAIRRRPDAVATHLALAASYAATGDHARELQVLSDAVRTHHRATPEILSALEHAQDAVGEVGARLETLERLRALHPRAPQVLRSLRDAYRAVQRWDDAAGAQEALVAELRDSDRLATEQARLLGFRYQSVLRIAEPRDRAAALSRLVERRGSSVPVTVSIGDAYLEAMDSDEAWATWERGLRSAPRTVFAERMTSIASDPRRQARLASVLAKLRPEAVNGDAVRLFVARTQIQAGRLDEAETALEAVSPAAAKSVAFHALRAAAWQKRGQSEQALLEFGKCLAAAPIEYRCNECKRASEQWQATCPGCGAWDSYRSTIEISPVG